MAEGIAPYFESNVQAAVSVAVFKVTSDMARVASEDYAPKGHTLQLSRGIRAIKPQIGSDGIITGTIISSARSAKGFDYAEKQHNIKLRHYTEQPLRQGFIDAGTSGNRRQKYRQGYIKLRDSSPKFATEYLTKAYEERREFGVRVISAAAASV